MKQVKVKHRVVISFLITKKVETSGSGIQGCHFLTVEFSAIGTQCSLYSYAHLHKQQF